MPDPSGKTKAGAPLLLCLGQGYVASALADAMRQAGWRVIGTSRTPVDDTILAFDGKATPALAVAAREAQAILCSIPPEEGGDPAFRALGAAIAAAKPAWIGYLSTTGVYGDRQGRWAFEDDPLTPQSLEAGRRAEAEAQWRAIGAHVFRLPGIYGPGRSPLDKLRAGTERRIDKQGQVFSRAHRDDIAAALAASIAAPNPGRSYNVCDDEPAPSAEVASFAAALLGLEPPPLVAFESADLSSMGRRFYSECKRVSNARAKAELGWRPRFPTYREGLRAILQGETAAHS
jgi:nucleoside-diphosphate-sugar epimerase